MGARSTSTPAGGVNSNCWSPSSKLLRIELKRKAVTVITNGNAGTDDDTGEHKIYARIKGFTDYLGESTSVPDLTVWCTNASGTIRVGDDDASPGEDAFVEAIRMVGPA